MKEGNWPHELDRVTEAYQQAFAALNVAQLNWKPNSETWSIAQNIDHLMVINSTYFPILTQLHQGDYQVPFYGKWAWYNRMMGQMILKSVQPETQRKIKTFPIWQPAESDLSADILTQFSTHQQKLKEAIIEAQPLLEQGALVSSPANSAIVYPLQSAFDIIVTHEKRHLLQAKAVQGQLPLNVS